MVVFGLSTPPPITEHISSTTGTTPVALVGIRIRAPQAPIQTPYDDGIPRYVILPVLDIHRGPFLAGVDVHLQLSAFQASYSARNAALASLNDNA
jgi:hypothetical protein